MHWGKTIGIREECRDTHVALINPWGDSAKGIPSAEDAANARLISAAPELLDAVLAALPYIEDLERDNITDLSVGLVSDKELTRALSAMVAAIEKAKGLMATTPK